MGINLATPHYPRHNIIVKDLTGLTSILYLSLQNCSTVMMVKTSICDLMLSVQQMLHEVSAVSLLASQDNSFSVN